MKEFVVLSGVVSHVNRVSSTGGVGTYGVQTSHRLQFRVDNRPAWYEGSPNIAEGEHVTLVGQQKDEFKAVALRNDATQIVYRTHVMRFLGFAKTVLVIGALLGCVGVWMIAQGLMMADPGGMLEVVPGAFILILSAMIVVPISMGLNCESRRQKEASRLLGIQP
jgi:hypothetical protein